MPNNKIGTITKTNGMVIQFTYDASGQRITKKVEKIVQGVPVSEIEFYLRDASGNVMANYILHPDSCTLLLKEQPIYGSSRLGVYAPNKDVTSNTVPSIGAQNAQKFTQIRGQRLYELSNWLGNVQVVITDKKLAICGSAQTPAYYEADIQSAQDYYPFGSLMPERNFNSAGYKYGMNGQEKTDEIAGAGNHTTAEFWEYDTRLGRRWNVDPKPIIGISEYACFNNNPIWFSDALGDTIKATQEGFNIINEGLTATLGSANPFGYDDQNAMFTYNSGFDKTSFSLDQLLLIDKFSAVVTSKKITTVSIVNFNEPLPLIGNITLEKKEFSAATSQDGSKVFIARNPQIPGMIDNPNYDPDYANKIAEARGKYKK
jgi:YD repeat-containing protein